MMMVKAFHLADPVSQQAIPKAIMIYLNYYWSHPQLHSCARSSLHHPLYLPAFALMPIRPYLGWCCWCCLIHLCSVVHIDHQLQQQQKLAFDHVILLFSCAAENLNSNNDDNSTRTHMSQMSSKHFPMAPGMQKEEEISKQKSKLGCTPNRCSPLKNKTQNVVPPKLQTTHQVFFSASSSW
jgi:hypothetical protein